MIGHTPRPEDTFSFGLWTVGDVEDVEGVWESARGGTRSHPVLRERVQSFRADPAVAMQALDQLAMEHLLGVR